MIRRIVRDDPEALDLLDQATVAPAHVHRDTDIVSIKATDTKPEQGNSRQYALRRLRKAAPEVVAALDADLVTPSRAAQDRAGDDFSGHPGLGSAPCASSVLTTRHAAT